MPRLRFQPGIIADDPAWRGNDPLRWIDGDNMRWRLGRAETIGLWRPMLDAPLEGRPSMLCEGASQTDTPGVRAIKPFLVVGTKDWLYRITRQDGAYVATKVPEFDGFAVDDSYGEGEPYGEIDPDGQETRPTIWTMHQAGPNVVAYIPGILMLVRYSDATIVKNEVRYPWANAAFVTDDDFLVYVGQLQDPAFMDPDAYIQAWNPRSVVWSDQGDFENLEPSDTTLAGAYELKDGSEAIGGGPTSRGYLVWTDTALYEMRPLFDAELVFGFPKLGRSCGLIGPNAWADADGRVFWISPQKSFHVFDGGVPVEIPCPVRSRTIDLILPAQQRLVTATTNVAQGEVTWFLPRGDGIEGKDVDGYVTFNYAENSWSYGSMARAAMVDRRIADAVYAVSPDGMLYQHELAPDDEDVEPRHWRLLSAAFEAEKVENTALMTRLLFDRISIEGPNCPQPWKLIVYARDWPTARYPWRQGKAIHAETERADLRIEGRQFQIELCGCGTDWHRFGDGVAWFQPGSGR